MIEQSADALRVGHDVADIRDGGEAGAGGRYQRIGPGGQDSIGGPDTWALFEQPPSFTQVGFFHYE